MLILSSRASQPRPCITTSRGASISLTSLAIVYGPLAFKICQIVPAVSPIWVIHDIEEELAGMRALPCAILLSVSTPAWRQHRRLRAKSSQSGAGVKAYELYGLGEMPQDSTVCR